MNKSFTQLLAESDLAMPTKSQDVDVDLYYADTSLTEDELAHLRTAFDELAQLRKAFKTRLAVQPK